MTFGFIAVCNLCGITWEHDRDTHCCFWCGNKSFRLTDRVAPSKDEDEDDKTDPGWKSLQDLVRDLDLDP